jgi:hypothetical protein
MVFSVGTRMTLLGKLQSDQKNVLETERYAHAVKQVVAGFKVDLDGPISIN